MGNVLSATEALSLINNIEQRFPVDEWIIDSIRIWPLVRIRICFELRDAMVASGKGVSQNRRIFGTADRSFRIIDSLAKYFWASLSDSRHNADPHKADAIFLGDQVSRILLDGAWYDRLCDPVADCLQRFGMTWFHMDPLSAYRVPRYRPSRFIQPALDFVRIKVALQSSRSDFAGDKLDRFTEFVAYTEKIGLLTGATDLDQLRRRVANLNAMKEYFIKVLRTVKPSVGFVVEYYCDHGMAFNLACRSLGISTIEVPHGNHGEIHVAYSRWSKVPDNGYELLPSVFWCWTEAEADNIRQWCSRHSRWHFPFVGGNPWLETWKQGNSDMVREYDERMVALISRQNFERHLLVTYEYNLDELRDIITKSPSTWFWWVRVHPAKMEQKSEIRSLLKKSGIRNFNLDAATEFPLYALLRHIDAHVTECSSVVIEAGLFGVPSVITKDYGVDAFTEQIASGWAVKAFSCDEILIAIDRQIQRKKDLNAVHNTNMGLDSDRLLTLLADVSRPIST